MTVLKTNETMTPEKRRAVEELGRKAFNHPASQILGVADGTLSPGKSFIKNWYRLIKHFQVLLSREKEHDHVSLEVVLNDIASEICILIREDENIGAVLANRLPNVIFWRLVGRAGKRLRETNKNEVNIYTDNIEMFENIQYRKGMGYRDNFVDITEKTNPHYMFFKNRWYSLIDGIAEQVGLSSQTLRNWEEKKYISFVRLDYKSSIKRIPYLRGVLVDDIPEFVKKIEELKNPPVGFSNTEDTLKKLEICHTTLERHRKSGKILFKKWKNKYFYKV